MAKTSKKKVGKKSRKPADAANEMTTVKPDVDYDDDDEEEKINENITSDEGEEESGEDERKHQKLLEAISSLGGKKKKKLGERSEAAVQMSEFTVNAEGEGDKIDLSDLIGTMDKTPAVSNKTKKQLKNLQQSQKTIECPLSKQETQRIQRDVAFQKTAAEVSKWKGIIKQNQRAEQLVFPLNREPSGPKPLEKVVCGWKARTPLEQEIFSLLSVNKQPIIDPVLTPKEEASLRAMSLEEAKIRRAELQKARALQSYYEAKAKRARRIKSKKYHKVQNKAKRKEFLRQFDEMAKTDPAAALEELSKMELTRMRERMSLKHQNSGKWAKSKAIMAKYDEEARKAMQQQLEVNKELTQKIVTSLNEEEEEEEEEEDAEVLPDFVNDAEMGPDPTNPWMRGKLSAEPAENETKDCTEPAAAAAGNTAEEEEEDEQEVEETEEDALLREFDAKRKLRQAQESDKELVICVSDDDDEEEEEEEEEKNAEAEDPDKEEEELSQFTSLYRGIETEAAADAVQMDASAPLEEGLVRIRTLEDVELLGPEEPPAEAAPVQTQNPPAAENPPPGPQKANRKRKRGIDLKEVLTKEAKVIQVPLAQTVEDGEDFEEKEEQRGLIKEAFAGDDVISDFLKDKRKQEDAGKPRVVDLTLPGWGEWGGTGLKPSRGKRKRFRMKAVAPPPRKDSGLPSVIISEAKGGCVGAHQVTSLPFPFENPLQFESTIRSPLGRTWNTERTVRKITKPKVVTQLGAIIEPIAREKLMKDKKQPFAVKTIHKNRVDSRKKTKR
uniref:U3 small nucleolar RNA-associated protein 14 homolog A n=1 Tax=Centroberyx gerrardi TaxID=166262 RepID=UPI003AB06A4A